MLKVLAFNLVLLVFARAILPLFVVGYAVYSYKIRKFVVRSDLPFRLKRSARMHFDSLSRSKQKHCFCAAKT